MKLDAALMEADIAQSGVRGKAYEEAGFDGVLSFEGPHDPFLPLVLVAAETSRVELLTAIAIAFARNPMLCAYMANDLQLISKGRFILGLGTQIKPHITRRFGQPAGRRETAAGRDRGRGIRDCARARLRDAPPGVATVNAQ